MAEYTERDIDALYRILDHCERIGRMLERFGYSLSSFSVDEVFRDAVKMNLLQIGEATNRLSDNCRDKMSEIDWHSIYGLRNIIAHGYEKLDDAQIWIIAVTDVPRLSSQIIDQLKEWGEDEDL